MCPKRGADAGLAHHFEPAADASQELNHHAQTDAPAVGSAWLPPRASGTEDPFELVLVDAATGIAHFEGKESRCAADLDRDATALGVFRRVGQEIVEHAIQQ